MSKSRWGGFKSGRKRYRNRWDDLRTPSSATALQPAPESPINFDYTTAQGIWNLGSTIQFRKTQSAAADLESGLSITNSFASGTIANGSIVRTTNAVFACEITLPSSFNSNGVLFEMGGTGVGAGVGLIGSGSTLVVAAGDGGVSSSSTIAAIAQIATSNLTAGDSGTLIWEFRINPGRVRVWWKGSLLAEESTTTGGALESNSWSGGDGGGYGQVNNSLTNALTSGNWPGTTDSNLRYYGNQLINV